MKNYVKIFKDELLFGISRERSQAQKLLCDIFPALPIG